MPKGFLITRGAIIESGNAGRWSIAVPAETSVVEVAALMAAFGCYGELLEGGDDIRLLPLDFRPRPTAEQLASFYAGAPGRIPVLKAALP